LLFALSSNEQRANIWANHQHMSKSPTYEQIANQWAKSKYMSKDDGLTRCISDWHAKKKFHFGATMVGCTTTAATRHGERPMLLHLLRVVGSNCESGAVWSVPSSIVTYDRSHERTDPAAPNSKKEAHKRYMLLLLFLLLCIFCFYLI
jgi:hypothetical protein